MTAIEKQAGNEGKGQDGSVGNVSQQTKQKTEVESNPPLPEQAAQSRSPASMVFLLIVLVCGISLGAWRLGLLHHLNRQEFMFSKQQLVEYNGKNGQPIYLAILGEVYDVTKGRRFYGGTDGYAGFVGKDASRSFLTGDFKNDLNDNVDDFDADRCAGLIHWRGFFRNHTDYMYKGKVVGAFYDSQGSPTDKLHRVESLATQAKTVEDKRRELEAQYVRCSTRWNQNTGGFVWCDDDMYPRKVTLQASGIKATQRCACFKDYGWSDIRQVYPGCHPQAHECQTQSPDPSLSPQQTYANQAAQQAQSVEPNRKDEL